MELLAAGGLSVALLRDFTVALFIGALIGLEREHQARAEESQFGGLRTFTLCALAGALAGWLDGPDGPHLLALGGLLALTALLGVSVYVEGVQTRRIDGLTTEVAALVTYLLGVTVTAGQPSMAVVLGIATFTVLTFKQPLHGGVRALGRDDINAGLKLLAATFIVLPLLPDRALDPWAVLNPYKLWLLVLLISSLSLVGYVAVRLLGPGRGLAVTGLFGGLVSSTAVTLSFARRSREDSGTEGALALGILIAWAVMFLRVVIEVAVVNAALLAELAAPLGAMFIASAVLLGWFYRDTYRDAPARDTPVRLRNPFRLTAAISFGLFFAAVLLAVRLAQIHVPAGGLYLIAALTGATDVDAITLSLAENARGELPEEVAVLAILIAAWSNTVLKCAMVVVIGSRALARRIVPATALIIGSGALVYLLGRALG